MVYSSLLDFLPSFVFTLAANGTTGRKLNDFEIQQSKFHIVSLAGGVEFFVWLEDRLRAELSRGVVADEEVLEFADDLARRLHHPRPVFSENQGGFRQQREPRQSPARSLIQGYRHRQFTGSRVTDPSNASFTGLYETLKLRGWSPELCANLGVDRRLLPDVLPANRIAGHLRAEAAAYLGLRTGTPLLTGIMDGSAGMLFAGAEHGRLFNVTGSTDVLALCTMKPVPAEQLLTRALGLDGKFLAVSTLAAVASAIYWARDQFFQDWPIEKFRREFHQLARLGQKASGGVVFDPYMAGERTSIEQRKGGFQNITLATTRTHLLSAIVEGLVRASAERLPLLAATGTSMLHDVVVSGGSDRLDKILRRDWPGEWKFYPTTDATMRGLGLLDPEPA